MLQDAFKSALTLWAGLQLAEGVHLEDHPRKCRSSTHLHDPCSPGGLYGWVHQIMLKTAKQDPVLAGDVAFPSGLHHSSIYSGW